VSDRKLYNITAASVPRKFVWFRVAKTGTRSVLALLQDNIPVFDIDNGYRQPAPAARYSEHFKFAFVRNPYTRLISGWRDKILNGGSGGGVPNQDTRDRLKKFDYFVDWLADQEPALMNNHFRPQSLAVPPEVDFLGRTESFDQDLAFVCGRIGLPCNLTIPHRNKSRQTAFSIKDAHRATIAKVTRIFESDFKRFCYAILD